MTFLSPRNPSIRRSPQAPLRAFPRGQDKRNPVTSLTTRRMPVKPRPLLGFSVFPPAFRYREASRMLKDPTTGARRSVSAHQYGPAMATPML